MEELAPHVVMPAEQRSLVAAFNWEYRTGHERELNTAFKELHHAEQKACLRTHVFNALVEAESAAASAKGRSLPKSGPQQPCASQAPAAQAAAPQTHPNPEWLQWQTASHYLTEPTQVEKIL